MSFPSGVSSGVAGSDYAPLPKASFAESKIARPSATDCKVISEISSIAFIILMMFDIGIVFAGGIVSAPVLITMAVLEGLALLISLIASIAGMYLRSA